MPAPADLVHQITTGTGNGNLTLSALTKGVREFDDVFGTGGTTNVFVYAISHKTAVEWEIGTGHMSDATTLVRDTIIASSNAGAAVSFTAGTKDVTCYVNAARMKQNTKGADIASAGTIDLDAATGDLIDLTGTTTVTTITLAEGQERTVRTTGIMQFTHSSTLVCPGNVNVASSAGDFFIFRGYASGVVRMVLHVPASGGKGPPVLLATASPSGVATSEFANIPQHFSYLIIVASGISSDTATRFPRLFVSSNNGSSYDTTAANYLHSADTAGLWGANATQTAIQTAQSYVKLFGYQTDRPQYITNARNASGAPTSGGELGTYVGTSWPINALRLDWNASGNFDAGTWSLYGVP